MRKTSTGTVLWRIVAGVITALAVLFCLLPVVLVFGLSFFSDVFRSFPPTEFSFDLYRQLFSSAPWGEAALVTLRLAVPAAALAILVVAPAVLILERWRVPGKGALELSTLAPLLIPGTAFAVSLYITFLNWRLIGQYWGLVAVEAVAAIPVSYLIVRAAVRRVDGRLEFVAQTLGAGRLRSAVDISLRLSIPAIVVALIYAFVTVVDDAMYITFLGGPGDKTVSRMIFDSLRFNLDQLIAPVSVLLMLAVLVVASAAMGLQSLRKRRISRGSTSKKESPR
ncbi:MAG: ABC transporter permease subunit [Candidatus Leucobacter sulfamidivorax]|nr:ABC transporter permease subunit [Candidatus Leucobacter sulfamidivorax]